MSSLALFTESEKKAFEEFLTQLVGNDDFSLEHHQQQQTNSLNESGSSQQHQEIDLFNLATAATTDSAITRPSPTASITIPTPRHDEESIFPISSGSLPSSAASFNSLSRSLENGDSVTPHGLLRRRGTIGGTSSGGRIRGAVRREDGVSSSASSSSAPYFKPLPKSATINGETIVPKGKPGRRKGMKNSNSAETPVIPPTGLESSVKTSTSRRGKKPPHELLTEEEKKANHIASEQKRRQNIRLGYEQLVTIVPTLSQCNRSEALILQRSVEYIKHLLSQKHELKDRLRELHNILGEPMNPEDENSSDEER
ncbi:uncharacterized protein VTP21DRAFT_10377 [Calcarisporiella thermophila]|uniref:uncharacterized protein n=1 Tax=Calcarisporiella thermophila TaxID=911321 RepID=UPI003743B132